MVINVLDHVTHCYTQLDGQIISDLITSDLRGDGMTVVSFLGVYSVSSSFVNAAFISLLDDYSFDEIKSRLKFTDSTKQINEMIKKRFDFEVHKRPQMECCA